MSLFMDMPQTLAMKPWRVRRVLVLDSNPNLRYIYIQALHRIGYEAYPAATIQEARDLLTTYDFDVFLTDTHLDYHDQGIELLREQMDGLTRNNVKIILMSSHYRFQLVSQEIGVDVFIEKPVAVDQLIKLVNRLVQERANDEQGSLSYHVKPQKQTQLYLDSILCCYS
jgi:DNA-binding NtrC family response regulator